ncbi:chemotaxis protein CheW [Gracilinema caldarium]|uniref:CheW protein n=1 Tax=Gracilinema caldarium (strain ATCC 51460 / DSM 7334 / H1) TaxID=744872 RepID=F8F3T4_GRAC1|nr:chemotaxis protein CheW [Gracilinema caldarium]AEJ20453.1 CheW protein [Gracilinema caldarium DSM 7334]
MAGTTNKYLVFTIEKEFYAIPIVKVQEVIRFTPITPLHETSRFLKGVINLRGRIIPIIDMRLKFNLQEKPYTDRTVFIIVEILGPREVSHIGMAVDAVQDVADIQEEQINRTPEVGFKFKSKYLLGIVQLTGRMVMLLNLDAILSTEEVVEIQEHLVEETK